MPNIRHINVIKKIYFLIFVNKEIYVAYVRVILNQLGLSILQGKKITNVMLPFDSLRMKEIKQTYLEEKISI